MSSHNASGQMVGYLYQVYSALLLILARESISDGLSIEKFDDIAFTHGNIPIDLIQTKHQIYNKGSLADTSIDLWRTINSWCDTIKKNKINISTTQFTIITTADAPQGSAAYFLSDNNLRDTKKATTKIQKAALGIQQTTQSYRNNFLSLNPQQQEKLVENIYVFDSAVHILNCREKLKKHLKLSILPSNIETACDQVEGWWFQKAVKFLCSEQNTYITQEEVIIKIIEIANSYSINALPIFDAENKPDNINAETEKNKVYIQQLELITNSARTIERAVLNHYKATCHRSRWLREGLLYHDDIENYDKQLQDEWERLFEFYKEKLEALDNVTNKNKKNYALELYKEIEELKIFIRSGTPHSFIMRGSYHTLADKLKVGWHINFYEKLSSQLLEDSNEKME